jgi:predicted TIM-barrel enzyme
VRRAHELGLLTTAYVFSAEDTIAMTEAGADIVVCHMGFTGGGSIGAGTADSVDDGVKLATKWAGAARSVRADVIVLVHGGSVRTRQTCGTSCAARPACTASTGHRPWNDSRPNARRRRLSASSPA